MLRFEGVTKAYGGRPALRSVSLSLEAGEILLLAGPNGSGKSTLLRLAAGLTGPTGGTVRRDMENIGYLGHATGLYPGLSALDNLMFWQRLYGLDASRDRLLRALDTVGLLRRAHDRAGSFSRGMAQRLALARLLLQQPDLLLLDEPTTGLDAGACALLVREIRAARARGAGILWVSHEVERDLSLADRAALLALERGGARLYFDGPAGAFPLAQAAAGTPC